MNLDMSCALSQQQEEQDATCVKGEHQFLKLQGIRVITVSFYSYQGVIITYVMVMWSVSLTFYFFNFWFKFGFSMIYVLL